MRNTKDRLSQYAPRLGNYPRCVEPVDAGIVTPKSCDYFVGTHPIGSSVMKARLIRIGNSRGVRLAKSTIEEAGLTDEVEIHAHDGAVIITPVRKPREGWAEAIARFGPGRLLDPPTPTRFDEEEWTWPL
jgi:antitoxin MazE